MTEEEVFLFDILARPDDDAPRLIYADWLDDRGDERAGLIRLDWELRGPFDAARQAFERERRETCRNNDWLEHAGLVLTREQFLFAFRLRLAETMAYCAGKDLPLRNWNLDPRTLTGQLDAAGWPYSDAIDWPGMVLQLAIGRRRQLERDGREPSRPAGGLGGGRLLVFDPWVALGVGQAMVFSNGYFDADNLPPWDTWVMQVPEPSPVERDDANRITPHYLIAWVPPAYVQRAASGVETNEEGSLRWLSQVTGPFPRALRAAGWRT